MSENRSWSGIGEEIRDAVETALRTGNFRDIGDVMKNTGTDIVKNVSSAVGQAVSGVGGAGGAGGGADGASGFGGNRTARYEQATRERKREQAERERAAHEQAARRAAEARRLAPFKRVGRISSVLYRVFGGIGAGLMGILSMVFFGLSLGLGGGWWVVFTMLALLLAACVLMICAGCKQKDRLQRAEKYVELAGSKHYINVEDLALHTGKSKKFIIKDIKKMMSAGLFPEGHLDMQESCLILNDKIYREYLDLEKQRRVQEREKKAQQLKDAVQKNSEPEEKQEESSGQDLDVMIQEGQECIRKLRDMNDNIEGEEISAKLFRLENLLKEIFEGLQEHPEQMTQMRKFMNYYLPTTLKLVAAYEEFDDLSAQSDEIVEAKSEIERTLDTINGAFEELLNRMFRSAAYDVTTDAQVLQTMLAQEGLTKQKEFAKVPRE